jgi:biotin synthase
MYDWLDSISQGRFDPPQLLAALAARGPAQEALFSVARAARDQGFPRRSVEVRSVVEISNFCSRGCLYCAIGCLPPSEHFTLSPDEFVEIVGLLHARGRKHILLQSGENNSDAWVDNVGLSVEKALEAFPDLDFIINLGVLTPSQCTRLRNAGISRAILKFETSNAALYATMKPGDQLSDRLEAIRDLVTAGFGTGSGNIVGLPGQTLEDLASDLTLLHTLPLTMASSTVFIPGRGSALQDASAGELHTTLNYMALLRVMNPRVLIPTTSSLEKAGPGGQLLGLMAGANTVTIHDGTPRELKEKYPIYSKDRFMPSEEHIRRIVQAAGLVMEES